MRIDGPPELALLLGFDNRCFHEIHNPCERPSNGFMKGR